MSSGEFTMWCVVGVFCGTLWTVTLFLIMGWWPLNLTMPDDTTMSEPVDE